MKYILTWRRASSILLFVFFVLSIRWSLLDNSPPAWDQGLYLYQSAGLHHVLQESGFWNFCTAVFNVDRGRVPLILMLVQPAFYFFEISLDAAVISLNFSWLILAWSIHGIVQRIGRNINTEKAYFFAFAFFGFYPLTVMLSHNFLVELSLSAWVCASIYSILMLQQTKQVRWSFTAGLFIGLGLLTKVTFVVFVFPMVGLVLLRLMKEMTYRELTTLILPACVITAIISCPYYLYNIKPIFSMTTFLSSKELAKLYGFGDVFDFSTIINYWSSVFISPVFLITACLFIFGSLRLSGKIKGFLYFFKNWNFLLMLAWFFIPFVLATFGEIKDPRYLFPALIPIFIISGIAAAYTLESNRILIFGSAIFLILLLPSYLYSNAFLGERQFTNFVNVLGIHMLRQSDQPPDPREWKTDQLVRHIGGYFDKKWANNKVVFLGGGRYYHLRLLDYEGLIIGVAPHYLTLPYYEDPDMSLEKALNFIYTSGSSGVLFKSGENWPKFSSRLDLKIIEILKNDPRYAAYDLGIEQPDGSRFTFFQNKAFLTVPIHSPSEVTGGWKVGGGVAAIDARDEKTVTVTTETGVRALAVIRDGSIYVQDWGVSGTITADAESIRWSNGSIWRKTAAR
ncbi:4-amino-4-deoxy-L-arabinose transferase-like glycosyltransferase [Rhodoferax ferrireducens]|uniref:4-amino-4-deoxy-L-arabinose transferase-like glycosyltransferase n=1 Tax=Rhodoferax ferrireducens TaxID=192843 RepID=A0ABU2C4M6_9BURK|nr:glycosyltransferase family 39 protein [Rhodoferax ferrireducens]MDR7376282.1 4-amino-4-deoxy-L-arabinose transferase-like glycosyltransferase [Rhodoferax ferrireducens]